MTFFALLQRTTERLKLVTDEAGLEARILVEESFDVSAAQVVSMLSEPVLDVAGLARLEAFIETRLTGVPLAYVLGKKWFRGRDYGVRSGVLIPRPETELLVEKCLELVGPETVVLECGVGSGIVGIEVKLACPDARVIGWDISETAIAVARENAEKFGVGVEFRHRDFFEDREFWMGIIESGVPVVLVSNPPYISEGAYRDLDLGVRDFEPREALVGGTDGLDYYRRFFEQLSGYETVKSVVEIGFDQGEVLKNLLCGSGYRTVRLFHDHSDIPRVLMVGW